MSSCWEGDQGPKHHVLVAIVVMAATDCQALGRQASETRSAAPSGLGIRTLGGQVRGTPCALVQSRRSPENALTGPFGQPLAGWGRQSSKGGRRPGVSAGEGLAGAGLPQGPAVPEGLGPVGRHLPPHGVGPPTGTPLHNPLRGPNNSRGFSTDSCGPPSHGLWPCVPPTKTTSGPGGKPRAH